MGYTTLDNDVIDKLSKIGPTAFAVYCCIERHTGADGACRLTQAQIAARYGFERINVKGAIRVLRLHGLLEVESRDVPRIGRLTVYRTAVPARRPVGCMHPDIYEAVERWRLSGVVGSRSGQTIVGGGNSQG